MYFLKPLTVALLSGRSLPPVRLPNEVLSIMLTSPLLWLLTITIVLAKPAPSAHVLPTVPPLKQTAACLIPPFPQPL